MSSPSVSAAAHGAKCKQSKATQIQAPFPSLGGATMILLKNSNSKNQEAMGANPIFRSESFGYYYPELHHNYYYTLAEKRQLFLRSYQFSRKQSIPERIKRSFVRAKKVVWLKLRSALRLRRLVCLRLKCSFYYRRRRFFRLLHAQNRRNDSSCFW
ncbi:uncharacterized protein LOC129291921 [Prosopis cineraria]|uniref:uncharacterized protein LOC129291921 n=1 Tax=Prosopis cineraria TaxID=364024 RepID=UPI0024103394|nr:uncharacterized protein LOC129291921 [Prosopis cineraria]